ncbi:flagellar hook protein FlgE [Massilia endophytica]|uniref:flagellar hook protein FlgE n=1 Tax=Massilia endophytica TaxID=2899220 RepID=UPI001E4FC295|nr:flagellar hook protein FlgE [Massilia endophytica]UGQ45229.1 flagellar hook protein FlgE [Massilia endophytica]
MFQQGLSGLNAATKSLDVIGNNIANASTVGFKSSEAQFADLYANSLNGVSGNNPGIGVSVARLAQQFTQGNIETTNNPLDISINGGGFFRTVVDGAVQYTRNGQFLLDKAGTLVNAQGAQVTGYMANKDGLILSGAPVPIVIDTADLAPVQTTKANFKINLDSRAEIPATVPFDAADPTTYNKQTVLPVYDSLGNEHVMSMFYVKTAGGQWDVYAGNDGREAQAKRVMQITTTDAATITARADYFTAVNAVPADPAAVLAAQQAYSAAAGAAVVAEATAQGADAATIARITELFTAPTDVGAVAGNNPDIINAAFEKAVSVPAVKVGTLVFNKSGQLDAAAMAALTPAQTLPFNISLPIFPDNGAILNMPIATTFDGITQYGQPTSEKLSSQDGYSSGTLQRFAADENGVIIGQYSNGKSRPLAQLVLADFSNVDGLTPLGNNAWAESSASGVPQIGVPGEGGMGLMRSSSVESSNVDLTEQLVDMITAQRVYQANAQTIKTEDSVLQTLVNMR